MLRYIFKKKTKSASTMSQEPQSPDPQPISAHEETQTVTLTPTSSSAVPTVSFMEVYDCAKNNHSWNKVSSAIATHPNWLIRIPQGRRWTILHQIVYSGNVVHLNEVLAYQMSETDFRLLFKASDDKTVREVAMERAHIHAPMLRRVESLVATDQLLNNARDNKWDLVRQFLRQQPDMVNEKPPYRKYYLAHYLALIGRLDIFRELADSCPFQLDLLADNKRISQIARENNHNDFAQFVEERLANAPPTNATGNNQQNSAADHSSLPYPTNHSFPSHSFYDDPGITFLSLPFNSPGVTFFAPDQPSSSNNDHYATHSFFQGQNPAPVSTIFSNSQQTTTNLSEPKESSECQSSSTMTDDEQVTYEKTIVKNANKLSAESLLNLVTCPITKSILADPVVAADGFTYERQAILNWFAKSNRSPMTNKELPNLDLKPNHAIKAILKTLSEPINDNQGTETKFKLNGDQKK